MVFICDRFRSYEIWPASLPRAACAVSSKQLGAAGARCLRCRRPLPHDALVSPGGPPKKYATNYWMRAVSAFARACSALEGSRECAEGRWEFVVGDLALAEERAQHGAAFWSGFRVAKLRLLAQKVGEYA